MTTPALFAVIGAANLLFLGVIYALWRRIVMERRKRFAVMEEAEDRYRVILDSIIDGIITIDEDCTIISANGAAELMFGVSSGCLAGRDVALLLAGESRSAFSDDLRAFQHAAKATTTGGIRREVTGVRADGSLFPLEIEVGSAVFEGRPVTVCIMRDISVQKEMGRQLLASGRRRSVMNAILRIGLKNIPLESQLEETLDELLKAEWLGVSGGGIFSTGRVVSRTPVVQRNLPEKVAGLCAGLTSGCCFCGREMSGHVIASSAARNELNDIFHDDVVWGMHAAVPVTAGDGPLGTLLLFTAPGCGADPANAEFLVMVASTLAVVIERKRLEVDLREAYERVSTDLRAAAEMQKHLLPAASSICGIQFEWLFTPCRFMAGDIFNYFRLDEKRIGFYLIDVAGHGAPAAMLSFTLSKVLSPHGAPLRRIVPGNPGYVITPPAEAVAELNRRFQSGNDAAHYFTMIYGIIDIGRGVVRLTQAGHPAPFLVDGEGGVTAVGTGGFPVGLLENVSYEEVEFAFGPGDRLILYSDGVTECVNGERELFSGERLLGLLEKGRGEALPETLRSLDENLRRWRGSGEFEDDVTIVAIERAE